ncbi:TetR/AcrR family transcriptional regulator [Nocardioides eburneiflavus]|uniref:TetR/AcrR family transcriptional regulator n=1 Tax=Nocardioides eburneiflavus TaxID=2518372 RepID=A0A4Z1C455_9ACTN|nr:TetR/AcrR family transcriptional regulator [Nocardioides eburneiflavus]TGN65064.1 TetR/AcrR family transcriptional regulator [Nocardioides eburneiflavus]
MARSSLPPGRIVPAGSNNDARGRLLDAAAQLFTEFGYEGTAVTRIAKAAGMTPANMYWHFPSKQDLLAEMLTQMYAWSHEYLVTRLPADGDPTTRLAAYVRAMVHIQIEALSESGNHSYLTLATSLEPKRREELAKQQRQFLVILKEILEDGSTAGVFALRDITVTTFAILQMCEYSFLWFRSGGRLTVEEVEDEYVALALRLVGAAPQE